MALARALGKSDMVLTLGGTIEHPLFPLRAIMPHLEETLRMGSLKHVSVK